MFIFFGEYWQYYLLGIILLPGLIFASWAQIKVKSTYNKYNKVLCVARYCKKKGR